MPNGVLASSIVYNIGEKPFANYASVLRGEVLGPNDPRRGGQGEEGSRRGKDKEEENEGGAEEEIWDVVAGGRGAGGRKGRRERKEEGRGAEETCGKRHTTHGGAAEELWLGGKDRGERAAFSPERGQYGT